MTASLRQPVPLMTGTIPTLTLSDETLLSALTGPGRDKLQSTTLPQFLPRQRWFGAKDRAITNVRLTPLGELEEGTHALVAADVEVGGEIQRYLLPVSALWGAETDDAVLAKIDAGSRSGVLIDSALHQGLAKALIDAMRTELRVEAEDGAVVFSGREALRQRSPLPDPRPLGAEQSNVSIAFGTSVILKLYRRLRAGEQPDVEVVRFLTGVAQFRNTPEFLGEIQFESPEAETTTLAAAFAFVPNEGDAWSSVTGALTQNLLDDTGEDGAWIGSILGQRTAEMHQALAVSTEDPDFAVEPLKTADIEGWVGEAVDETEDLLRRLEQDLSTLPPSARKIAEDVLGRRDTLIDRLRTAASMPPSGGRSRIHGDYHLGQVLITARDVMIIDFEGEPKRSLAERRAKSSPLRDVSGMLRSFHYAGWTALSRYEQQRGSVSETVRARAEHWRQKVSGDFISAYEQHIAGASSYPPDRSFARALADLFLLQKAAYEVSYELANRPDWVEIPLSGIQDLLNEAED